MSEKLSREHRHECPLCGASVPCADRLPHRVGHAPEIRLSSGGLEPEQRFKLCTKCARREKGMKSLVGGDVAILAQLIERGLPPLNPVDVLAGALVRREHGRALAALDLLYGQTPKHARRFALEAYDLMRHFGEPNAALTVMRRYPLAGFQTVRSVAQAAYRRRHPKPAR
jgi:hypothetical protein